MDVDRDVLGRVVRKAWVQWARTQLNAKPSWLVPYDSLTESDKEADRQIGEAVAHALEAVDLSDYEKMLGKANERILKLEDVLLGYTFVWYHDVAHILAGPGKTLCGRKTKRTLTYRKVRFLSLNTDITFCRSCKKILSEK